ncbi:cytochrome c [Azohydromonas australica]|uniref:cytochrome c n=1 Tax=Azohydromonas australica TaxID=364039 RepID=UPI0003FEB965|nr:cytochrome c [Azohydromonas australica]
MKTLQRLPCAVSLALASALAWPQAHQPRDRGELLYEAHCLACHNAEVHWREGRRATDWGSLLFQVRRWQDVSGLQWDEADVQAVARYLNDNFYRFPRTVEEARAP